jgi:hypothetical protein
MNYNGVDNGYLSNIMHCAKLKLKSAISYKCNCLCFTWPDVLLSLINVKDL